MVKTRLLKDFSFSLSCTLLFVNDPNSNQKSVYEFYFNEMLF